MYEHVAVTNLFVTVLRKCYKKWCNV